MITIKLNNDFTSEQESWLLKNVGPRLHWLHNSRGGKGWIAKHEWDPGMVHKRWYISFEDERYATFFKLMFPE